MKAGPNYRMTKQTKRSLALGEFRNADDRNAWKRAMIGAELAALIQPKREKGRKSDRSE